MARRKKPTQVQGRRRDYSDELKAEAVQILQDRHAAPSLVGNSHKVTLKHYLQVTDEDFEAASGIVDHSPEKVDHIVDQHSQAPTRTELPRNEESPCIAEAFPDGAVRFRSVPVVKVGDAGLQHSVFFTKITALLM